MTLLKARFRATPHKACAEDTPSDFSSDCIEISQAGCRLSRNSCAKSPKISKQLSYKAFKRDLCGVALMLCMVRYKKRTALKIKIQERKMENKRIIIDCHNHSTQSPDGKNTVREMLEQAIRLGMEHYTITDHLEINKFFDKEFLYEEPVKESSVIVPALKKEFQDKIGFYYGVELGQPLHDIELTTRILKAYDYDFIIGSCHMVREFDDFYYLDYNVLKPKDMLEKYFNELLEMAQWGGFDVLGHLTYPLRYITGDFGIQIDMKPYDSIIAEIFRTLIKNGMGIEVNTSGLRQKIGVTMPDSSYIKLFRRLGGEIITIGSDAHCAEDLGKGINEGLAMIKEAGFDKIWYFEKRQPKYMHI